MKGQTLVEVVVALGAGVVILTALIVIILTSLNNSSQSSSEALGTSYAQEGMETLRQLKENDWPTFSSLNGSYCMAESCTTLVNGSGSCGQKSPTCAVNVANRFIREVSVTRNDSTCTPPTPVANTRYTKVTTIVSWRDSKCTSVSNPYCHSVRLESCLSNFNVRAAP